MNQPISHYHQGSSTKQRKSPTELHSRHKFVLKIIMMPTRNIVRVVPPPGGGGVVIITAPAGNSPPSSSSSSSGTATASSGAGEVNNDVDNAASALTSLSSILVSTIPDGGKNGATALVDTTSNATESPQIEGDANQEGVDVDVESGQSKSSSPRREDFDSVLEYLEAKYVKSIKIEDGSAAAAADGSEQADAAAAAAAAKSQEKNEVELLLRQSILEAHQLEKKMEGQNTKKIVKGGNAANSTEKLPVPSSGAKFPSTGESATAHTHNTAASIIAEAESKKKALLSSSETTTNAFGYVVPKNWLNAMGVTNLPQPPQQQQNQNTTEAKTSGPVVPQQYPQGYAPWPQCPPPGYYPMMPFPPPPFGGMYPPYPPPSFGMQPPPMQGQKNQPPPSVHDAQDAGKNDQEDGFVGQDTILVSPLPALPPIDAAALGVAPLVQDGSKCHTALSILSEENAERDAAKNVVEVPSLPALPRVKDTTHMPQTPSFAKRFHENLPSSSSKKRKLDSSKIPEDDVNVKCDSQIRVAVRVKCDSRML